MPLCSLELCLHVKNCAQYCNVLIALLLLPPPPPPPLLSELQVT